MTSLANITRFLAVEDFLNFLLVRRTFFYHFSTFSRVVFL